MLRKLVAQRGAVRGLTTLSKDGVGTFADVVSKSDDPAPKCKAGEVLVDMVRAPVTKLDAELVMGLKVDPYGNKRRLGTQGVGIVSDVGSNVSSLKKGDIVAPRHGGLGTFSTQLVAKESALFALGEGVKKLDMAKAANAGYYATAAIVLKDVPPGTAIVQSVFDEALAEVIADVASKKNLFVITVLNDGLFDADKHEKISSKMKRAGSELVIPETLWSAKRQQGSGERYLGSDKFKELVADAPEVSLAVNAAGGFSATEMLRLLGKNGRMVTLGGKPFQVPPSVFTSNNVTLTGFDYSNAKIDSAIASEVVDLIQSEPKSRNTQKGKMRPKHTGLYEEFDALLEFKISEYDQALERAFRGKKVQMVF